MRGLRLWALTAVCAAAFAAAGCGAKDLSEPPKILYGQDACAQCRMIIQDERFACAAVSEERRYLKFDDIGCLAQFEKKQGASVLRSWVHDADTARWIPKESAHFVYHRDLVTPMGYGFEAFASAGAAEKAGKENGGRVVTWSELNGLKTEEVK